MRIINNNSIKILVRIRDVENNLGLCEGRGMTKEQITTRCEMSTSTINRGIKLLKDNGYIKEGIMSINRKTYYITQQGINLLKAINKRSI